MDADDAPLEYDHFTTHLPLSLCCVVGQVIHRKVTTEALVLSTFPPSLASLAANALLLNPIDPYASPVLQSNTQGSALETTIRPSYVTMQQIEHNHPRSRAANSQR